MSVLCLSHLTHQHCTSLTLCDCRVYLTWHNDNDVTGVSDTPVLCLPYLRWYQCCICLTWHNDNVVSVYMMWCQCCVCLTWCDVNVVCLPDVMSMLCRSSSRRLIFSSSSCLSMSYKRSFSLWKHKTTFLHFRVAYSLQHNKPCPLKAKPWIFVCAQITKESTMISTDASNFCKS